MSRTASPRMSLAPARLGALSLSALSFAVLSLAACSSAADPPPATSAGARPSASTPKQAAPSEPAVPSSAGSSAVDAAALCAYLTGELPALQAIGSEVGAMANLAGNLFAWYDEQGAVPNGTEIDEQTLQECPDVWTEVRHRWHRELRHAVGALSPCSAGRPRRR